MNYRRMKGETRKGARARRSYLRRQWFQSLRTTMTRGGAEFTPPYREWLRRAFPLPLRKNVLA
jgi:hypothetical protein